MKSYSMANMMTYGWLNLNNEEKQKTRGKQGISISRRSAAAQLLDDKPPSVNDFIKDDYALSMTYFIDKPNPERSRGYFQLLD